MLYRDHPSRSALETAVADYAEHSGQTLRCATAFARDGVDHAVAAALGCPPIGRVMAARPDDGWWLLEMHREWGEKQRQSERGACMVMTADDHGHVFHVISSEGSAFWCGVLDYAVRRAYPGVTRAALTTREMGALLEELANSISVPPDSFRVVEMSYQSRLDDGRARRPQKTDRTWTDTDLHAAFQELDELDASLNTIRFNAYSNGRVVTSGALRRVCELSYAGPSEGLLRSMIPTMARITENRMTLLSGRARQQTRQFEAKPFFIAFDDHRMEDSAARARLLHALARMSNTSQSVVHANPYVHLRVLDYLEDTSCDVYVMASDRITIVPQTRSSSSSLERIYAHICAEFGEGRLVDFEEVYPA